MEPEFSPAYFIAFFEIIWYNNMMAVLLLESKAFVILLCLLEL